MLQIFEPIKATSEKNALDSYNRYATMIYVLSRSYMSDKFNPSSAAS